MLLLRDGCILSIHHSLLLIGTYLSCTKDSSLLYFSRMTTLFQAFACPQLSHANAIQSYRSALNAFSTLQSTHPYRIFITFYWISSLFLGTALSIYIITKYLYTLQSWVQPHTEEEEQPPDPNESVMCDLLTIGDEFVPSVVSPVVLQANETGILVMISGDVYKRTKTIPAIGFTPTLTSSEMAHEHQLLLDYIAKHPLRGRQGSVSGVDMHYGLDTMYHS